MHHTITYAYIKPHSLLLYVFSFSDLKLGTNIRRFQILRDFFNLETPHMTIKLGLLVFIYVHFLVPQLACFLIG